MTDFGRSNPENTPDPTDAAGQATPPPAPFVQPPLPGETVQPYAAAPYEAAPYSPHPAAPQSYEQPHQPYGQYPQQPYGAPQPPQPPYPGQPYYQGAPQPPQKKKVWPWVLGGCLVVFFLFSFVGCVSCAAFSSIISSSVAERYDPAYDKDFSLRDDFDDAYNYDDKNNKGSLVTLDEIKEAAGTLPNTIENGQCSPGVYEVGAGEQIEAGRYFFEGSQTAETNFYVFSRSSTIDSYELDDAVVYFGNYYADLEAGDVVVFMGADDLRMYPAAKGSFKPEAPYQSGLYLVGTDLPAGTYTITVNDEVVAAATGLESAAFVMKDLEFDDDSITETKYVASGGSQTITVKAGDWLELYAATATPANATP